MFFVTLAAQCPLVIAPYWAATSAVIWSALRFAPSAGEPYLRLMCSGRFSPSAGMSVFSSKAAIRYPAVRVVDSFLWAALWV